LITITVFLRKETATVDIRRTLSDLHELRWVRAYRDDGAMLLGKAIGTMLGNTLVGGCERVISGRLQPRFEAKRFVLLMQYIHHFGCGRKL
jgi:hypothetical protein